MARPKNESRRRSLEYCDFVVYLPRTPTSNMATPESKHTALATAIAEVCYAKTAPQLNSILAELVTLRARLEVLETINPPKRNTRVSAKPAGAKPGGVKGAKKSNEEKVTNALLFFRYALKNDLPGFREAYADENAIVSATASKPDVIGKKDRVKDEPEFYSAVGGVIWKDIGPDIQKEIRTRFDEWRNNLDRANEPAPLEEEAVEEGVDEAADAADA